MSDSEPQAAGEKDLGPKTEPQVAGEKDLGPKTGPKAGPQAAPAAAAGPDSIVLWTCQAPVVVDTIRRDGVTHVKREYVERKYGDAAWSFEVAYGFFRQGAERLVPRPAEAESAIWAYRREAYAYPTPGSYSLMLEVPRDQCVLFDLRVWNKILQLRYVGSSRKEERDFEHELERQGVKQPGELFSTPFYPVLKRKVTDSWQRLFASAEGCDDDYVQAGLWEIRSEWVRHCARLEEV